MFIVFFNIIRYHNRTEIYWNDAKRGGADIVYARENWTESFVQWSPLGNYLATMHTQGVALWGGPDNDEPQRDKIFQRAVRFEHRDVKLIDFSPNEEYIVTWSPPTKQSGNKVVLRIFNSRNGRLMREFEGSTEEFAVGQVRGREGDGEGRRERE
jgi:translation initiation factor 3 subunit B